MRPGDIPCPAPDRSPHPPRTPLPAYSCDTHAHVLGPAARFPYVENRIYTPSDTPLGEYLGLLDTLGVQRAVLVQPSVYGADNRALIDALERTKSGLRGVAVIDEDCDPKTVKILDAAGVRGIRLNVVDHNGPRNVVPVESVKRLARLIAPFGWHIEFLVNVDEAPGFAAAVAGLPVDVVIGHMGYPRRGAGAWQKAPEFDSFLRFFETGRCWVKLTGPYRITAAKDIPYSDVTPLAQSILQANPERVVWGTDWPHVMMKKPMPNEGDLTDSIADWIPDEALRARVLVDNPARLYGFGAADRLPLVPAD